MSLKDSWNNNRDLPVIIAERKTQSCILTVFNKEIKDSIASNRIYITFIRGRRYAPLNFNEKQERRWRRAKDLYNIST